MKHVAAFSAAADIPSSRRPFHNPCRHCRRRHQGLRQEYSIQRGAVLPPVEESYSTFAGSPQVPWGLADQSSPSLASQTALRLFVGTAPKGSIADCSHCGDAGMVKGDEPC